MPKCKLHKDRGRSEHRILKARSTRVPQSILFHFQRREHRGSERLFGRKTGRRSANSNVIAKRGRTNQLGNMKVYSQMMWRVSLSHTLWLIGTLWRAFRGSCREIQCSVLQCSASPKGGEATLTFSLFPFEYRRSWKLTDNITSRRTTSVFGSTTACNKWKDRIDPFHGL